MRSKALDVREIVDSDSRNNMVADIEVVDFDVGMWSSDVVARYDWRLLSVVFYLGLVNMLRLMAKTTF